jgi:regulator of RNase E activity RraB
VTASKQLDLTCENISAVELQLKAMAETYGGNSDGWGFLED